MKIKSLFVAVLLMAGVLVAPAHASQKPTVESFTFTPDSIDIVGAETSVNFELVVAHPSGIETITTSVTLSNAKNDTFGASLTRTDSPRNSALSKVTFKGALVLPRGIEPGAYTVTSTGVKNNSSAGYQFDSGSIVAGKVRTLIGAESGVLVRTNGNLNLNYKTFEGPAFDKSVERTFADAERYRNAEAPIWKVGEVLDPSKYYEMRVPSLKLLLTSSSPSVCAVDGGLLKLIATGECTFKASTEKTPDYLAYSQSYTTTIQAARIKPQLVVNQISNQTTINLPKSIKTVAVYGPLGEFVIPVSKSPSICYVTDFYVYLLAGGRCTITYQTQGTSQFLASDLYTVGFDISKDGLPIVAPTPVVTPTPTATAKPVVKRTISCVKGTKTVKRTAVSPKCPKGYKLKK
jgi:hypothetical protein